MTENGMKSEGSTLTELRQQLSSINHEILHLLNKRSKLVQQVRVVKELHEMELFSPSREKEMLENLMAANTGPLSNEIVQRIFMDIFRASLYFMETSKQHSLKVTKKEGTPDVVVQVGNCKVGLDPIVIAGPCSIEDETQMEQVAENLVRFKVGFLRGGAFKPRTSPYSFQGLGKAGLQILQNVGKRHGLKTVTEVVDVRSLDMVAQYTDVLQIGCRNMYNYELLKAAASIDKPILLKRNFAATLDEFRNAAEYILLGGNEKLILCERGIRTFERQTRNTLDISAVALLREMCRFPVIVDISHAAGRRDILPQLARASLAAGAQGIMVEVHPNPYLARSDSDQQIDLKQFTKLLTSIGLT